MTSDFLDRFVALSSAGGGLLLAGVLLALVGKRPVVRAAILVTSAGLAVGVAAVWSGSWELVGLTAVILAVAFLLNSRWMSAVGSRILRMAARPEAVAVSGMALVVGAGAMLNRDREEQMASNEQAVETFILGLPPERTTESGAAVTDRGTRLSLSSPTTPNSLESTAERETRLVAGLGGFANAIRRGPADERSNCFGWVFAQGRYWLDAQAIDPILTDNGYQAVAAARPGDLVIYRESATGKPTHAALVRYAAEGQPVLVEGKWGWGGVYLHEVDKSSYGQGYTFYRSPRGSHQLALTGVESGAEGVLTGAE